MVVGSCGYLLVVLGESEFLWNNCGLYEVVVGLFWMIVYIIIITDVTSTQ